MRNSFFRLSIPEYAGSGILLICLDLLDVFFVNLCKLGNIGLIPL